jgi:hypothetical protein
MFAGAGIVASGGERRLRLVCLRSAKGAVDPIDNEIQMSGLAATAAVAEDEMLAVIVEGNGGTTARAVLQPEEELGLYLSSGSRPESFSIRNRRCAR